MTAGTATSIALVLFALGLAPVVWLAMRPASIRWLGPLCGALVVGTVFYQTGLFRDGALASTEVSHLVRADTPESRCQQVIEVLTENQILLEPPGNEGLVVRADLWDQLPQPVREAVLSCAQFTLSAEGDVPVIRR